MIWEASPWPRTVYKRRPWATFVQKLAGLDSSWSLPNTAPRVRLAAVRRRPRPRTILLRTRTPLREMNS